MKNLGYIFLLLMLLTSSITYAQQPDSKEAKKAAKVADIKNLLDQRNFVFKAQYANPLGGGTTALNGKLINITPGGTGHIYLNYDYDVKIRPDSVISFLPYYGTITFDPPYSPTDDGIKFTSTKFGYKVKQSKKGRTIITITPQDAKYIQKLILDVSPEGYANLNINITNRYSISYDGYIAAPNKDHGDKNPQSASTGTNKEGN
ncbi:DUF4251 domain-containing protein [Mucilaginibacter robiniae]|uniref:DUF4251 domain-containing protein n=1 Tax=Mucilaginibacter robiniae TaxID=2728022 RepID=A0A7L5E8L1_9SPHI|nr:DUF4251 domain-containing protein [Mucilaginibacter robiniae]QJD98194.1 DUF4251 domain-containing protein [Mucilaginibacter robiniae]